MIMSNKFQHKITIKEVAEKSGVAISTVSRVLNGRDRVSDSTRRKVESAIAQLNYSHNPVAAALITKRTNIILVVVPDFINNFFSTIVQGVEEQLKSLGYYSMVTSTGDVSNVDIEYIRQKFSSLVDGVIVIPSSESFINYKNWDKPYVIVDRYIMGSNMNAVVEDNYGGTYRLTEELISSGHKKIAIISGNSRLCVCSERIRGYKDALISHGIVVNDDYVCLGDMYQQCGESYFNSLMSSSNPPTAIVAGNNLICEGCIIASRNLGYEIGKDISLVGFDDSLLARINIPAITVVDTPALEMGKRAAAMLLKQINNATSVAEEIILGVELVVRNSIKKIQ